MNSHRSVRMIKKTIVVLIVAIPVVLTAALLHFLNFPVEKHTEDGSFVPTSIGWDHRYDIFKAVLEQGELPIKTAVWHHFMFHVFSRRGHVFVFEPGEAGTDMEISATEEYTGEPHAHHFTNYQTSGP